MKEKVITQGIRGLLKSLNIFHWKEHGGLGSAPGVPDIVGCYQGRMLAIEVKTDRGRVSEHQQWFIDNINAAGGLAFVARSVDDVIVALGVQDRFLQFRG
jgi:Holliday junction resolvase